MLQKTSSFIFSGLMLVSGLCFGQKKDAPMDSSLMSFKPTGVRIGTDVIALGRTFAKSDFKGWELNADLDLRNYYPVIEIGQWQRNFLLTNGQYTNNGGYWRLGVDINFLKKDLVKNMFFFGMRVGHSKYNEKLDYMLTTSQFGDYSATLTNTNMKATWAEFTTGMKVKVFKGFWMGYTGRLKFFANYSKDQQLQSYDIPGYGLTFKKQWWWFNYYLMFRIPVAKSQK